MDTKDKLKNKVEEKYWTKECRMFFACDDFSYLKENTNILVAFTINRAKFVDSSRKFYNQGYITRNMCDEKMLQDLFEEECVVAIEPENVLKISFPQNETTFIELTSCYLYSTQEADFTSNIIMNNNKKLHKIIQSICGIQDRKNNYVSVLYKIRFVSTGKIVIEENISNYMNIPYEKPNDIIVDTDFDESISISPQMKTKKIKKTNFKRKKRRCITEDEEITPDEYFSTPQEDVVVEPKIIEELSYIPKSREEYFRRAYIQSSQCKVVINDLNIYNGSVFTKRVYILWDNVHISFNMRWYFSSEEMNEIVILLDDLYKKEPRFRIQANYYKNILITHPIHYDNEGGLIGKHFNAFLADSGGIEKTKTLHFYIFNDKITSITFKEFSQIEEFV